MFCTYFLTLRVSGRARAEYTMRKMEEKVRDNIFLFCNTTDSNITKLLAFRRLQDLLYLLLPIVYISSYQNFTFSSHNIFPINANQFILHNLKMAFQCWLPLSHILIVLNDRVELFISVIKHIYS